MPANRGLYTSNKDKFPNQTMFTEKQKFQPKFLVGVAISEAVLSEVFIEENCDSMNKTRYIEVLGTFFLFRNTV